MKEKTIAIVHYNTPELTEAAIKSIRKHGGEDYKVVIFDNSDKRPFKKRMKGVKVLNNREGQIIDFAKELEKYPERDENIGCCNGCYFGSDIHMMSVQKLWELLPDGFVLMESDILLKRSIDEFFREEYSVVGYHQHQQPGNKFGIGRMLPMLCWMNVPMLTREGARYFDPDRSWMLHPGEDDKRNWYDTGACLLDDILTMRPRLKGLHVDIRNYVVHFGSGSWNGKDAKAWLEQHADLWR